MEQYLTIWDLVLTPIYLIVLIAIARRIRNKNFPVGHPLRKYYLPGLYAKFGGAIIIGVIFQFYYGFGDTFNYYVHSKIINSALNTSGIDWWKLVTRAPLDENPSLYQYTSQMFWYNDPPSYSVCVIAAVLGLLNGTTYIPIALLFAFISYSGIWAMFKIFVSMYPKLQKQLAVAFLFIPSTVMWGSGIFKDTVCMFGLGWLTYSVFNIFINRDFSIKNFFYLVLSFYLIATIKIYILLAFFPAIVLWVLLVYSSKIQSAGARLFIRISVISIVIVAFAFAFQQSSRTLNKYSIENIAQTAEQTRTYIGYVSEVQGGSGYNLGDFDGSVGGMLTKFPAAVVVTLYRPFLWEAGKPIVFLSALEALLFLYFTILAFYRNGLGKSFGIIRKDSNLIFCLIFSIIFAFAVGITSYNFGALSRYKIPCLPFYAAFLIILLYNHQTPKSKVTIRNKIGSAPLNR